MFYHLKIAFRNIRRNSTYSVINVGGLAIALAVVILITLWVKDELSYDRFHKKGEDIYRIMSQSKGNEGYWETTPAPLAAFLQKDMPQIEEYCRIGKYPLSYLDYDHTLFKGISGLAVDTSFFDMFSFHLLKGDAHRPFPDDLSMIISETQAKTIFGNEDPIGKTLTASNNLVFHVTGIMEDMPQNSSITTDVLVRFDVQQRLFRGNGDWKLIDEDWGHSSFQTYLKLTSGSNIPAITTEIEQKIASVGRRIEVKNRLQPLYETHLYFKDGTPAGLKTVYIFSIIALLILIIACINYVNLVTARASKRSREIAVRKIVGAKKYGLLQQMMGETVVMLFFSLVLATLFIYLLLPFYNELAGKQMQFSLFNLSTLFIYLGTTAATLLLAGLYPAFTLSSFRPIDAFHSDTQGGKAIFRKILVVAQFTFSIGLIIATIGIGAQLRYMQHMNLGYNKENVFTVNIADMGSQYATIRDRLLVEPSIVGISGSPADKMEAPVSMGDIWQDKETKQWILLDATAVDSTFFSLMDIQFVAGRNFLPSQAPNPFHRGIIVNEAAAKLIGGGQSVIGMHVDKENAEIIGVVKDFNYQDLRSEIRPLMILYANEAQDFLYVKTASGKAKEAVAAVEKVWKDYPSKSDFTYGFLDEEFEKTYKSDLRTSQLFSIFAIIAVFISCLGLFGLVTYTAETKTKEIGIRKVLGASTSGIVEMLSKEFLVLVCMAMFIAFPVAYYWLHRMLQDYAYRIGISWWIFAAAALIIVILTLLTVGYQAMKAATANPVKSLKTE